MSYNLTSQLRHLASLALFLLQGTGAFGSADAICYSTPSIAIYAVGAAFAPFPHLKNGGYRVTKIQSDPVLQQKWAMIASCDHPEWPALALPANGARLLMVPHGADHFLVEGPENVPVVRAGEIVRLWKQESLLRIEIFGVSEQSGFLGKTIRVRLLPGNIIDQSTREEISGVVRGRSNVEMVP
jgi:hypothetical protein